MSATIDNVITVNAGSSSVKLAVFVNGASGMSRLFDIAVSDIGQSVSRLHVTQPGRPVQTEEMPISDHTAASRIIMERLALAMPLESIVAIGHRLVHGGVVHTEPTLAANVSEDDWELLGRLDPQHTPAAQQLIIEFSRQYPSVRQVVCFDTAFFHDLPHVAKIMPIPQKYYETGARRYGFHGLSYESLLSTFREKAGETAANGRVVLAHLGSGASLTATRHGRPVDTTMGLTPASGITMSTRSGDLDPTICNFLRHQNNISADEFDYMVNFESGLLGVSGVTGDMRQLLTLEEQNKDAAMAIELFVLDVKKSIGALSATLGGVDSLIFSGGIGEQSAILRSRICQGLGYMGIAIDETANEKHSFLISAQHSKAGVHVIPTDEAQVIALQTVELLNVSSKD